MKLTATYVVARGTPLPLYPLCQHPHAEQDTSSRRRTTVRPPEQVALKACGTYGQRRLLWVLRNSSPLARSTSRSAVQEKESQVTDGTQGSLQLRLFPHLSARGSERGGGQLNPDKPRSLAPVADASMHGTSWSHDRGTRHARV